MMTSKPSALMRFHQGIEAELKASITDNKSPFFRMLRYHLGWIDQMGMPERHGAQDRVLGTLTLLANTAAGGSEKQAMPAAAAIELIKAYFEIHEHLRTGTPEVNGRPTLWWHSGHSQGINAGDGMYAIARLTLMRLENNGVAAERIVKSLAEIDRACLRYTESLYGEISAEADEKQNAEGYLNVLQGKAALYGCASAIGVLLANAKPQTLERMKEFGEHIGMAAAIRNEVATIWGSSPSAKAQLIEMLDKRRSLPVLVTFKMTSGKDRESLESTIVRDEALSDERLEQTMSLMERVGAKAYCEGKVQEHLRAGLAKLSGAGLPSGTTGELEEVARYLTND